MFFIGAVTPVGNESLTLLNILSESFHSSFVFCMGLFSANGSAAIDSRFEFLVQCSATTADFKDNFRVSKPVVATFFSFIYFFKNHFEFCFPFLEKFSRCMKRFENECSGF